MTIVNYPRGSGKNIHAKINIIATPQKPNFELPGFELPGFELTPQEDEKAKRKNRHLEAAEQIEFMNHVRACLDEGGNPLPGRDGADLIFALANENAAGRGIGVLRWKMGVKPGLPDIGIFVPALNRERPGYVWKALFIEMKRADGVASDVKPAQKAVHAALDAAGYKVVVCYGWRRAWAVTCEYLGWEDKKQ